MQLFSRYILVGLFNTFVGYFIIFTLMYLMQFSAEISNLLGYSFGLLISYFLNRSFTFKSNQLKRNEFLRFIIVFCLAYGANFVMLIILIHLFDVDNGVSQLLAGVVYVVISFILNKYFVFIYQKVEQ